MERALKNRLTFGTLMLAAMFGLLWFDAAAERSTRPFMRNHFGINHGIGGIGLMICLMGLLLGSIPIIEFLETGKISRFPTAILAASIEVVGVIVVFAGIIMDSVNHHFRELSSQIVKVASRSGH